VVFKKVGAYMYTIYTVRTPRAALAALLVLLEFPFRRIVDSVGPAVGSAGVGRKATCSRRFRKQPTVSCFGGRPHAVRRPRGSCEQECKGCCGGGGRNRAAVRTGWGKHGRVWVLLATRPTDLRHAREGLGLLQMRRLRGRC